MVLFATQYKTDTVLTKDTVDALNNVQNKVIQDDKIYALKNDGDYYAVIVNIRLKINKSRWI